MPARVQLAVRFSIALTLAAAPALLPGPAGAFDELTPSIVPFAPPVSTANYRTVDYGATAAQTDDRFAVTKWRVVEGTGNCCETYVTTTSSGRLLDFGGRYIHFSDNRGLTWSRVQPIVPLLNGEGAIVVAPDGDVLGVQWDPYSGDHLQFYKYEATTGAWRYTEMPLHQPFYDREWIAVLDGPVTIAGETHEYVSFVKGAVPKELWFYSTDGLHYHQVTSKAVEQMIDGREIQGPLPTATNPVNDWIQENTNGGMTQLGAGDLLASPDFADEWALLEGETFKWSSYRFPDGSEPEGLFQVDSARRIHNLIVSEDRASFEYRISSSGGRKWRTTTVQLPPAHTVEEIDFRAHRSLGIAAVAMRAHDEGDGNDQDLVYKLGIATDTARVARLYYVGLGDVDATAGVGNAIRFDFESVTIFPDGRIAVSFLDSTTEMAHPVHGMIGKAPAIAIELDTKLGESVPPPVPTPPPVLGEPYASYTWDESAEGWTTAGVPATWQRSSPGTKTGPNDPSTASFGIEGPTQYVDNVNATLTSPPIATDPGPTVLEFWYRSDLEEGFDFVRAEWSADGTTWNTLAGVTGRNPDYPNWNRVTLGFESPGGEVRVRFRFTSDLLCSAVPDPAFCGGTWTGARVDEVVVGKQAA